MIKKIRISNIENKIKKSAVILGNINNEKNGFQIWRIGYKNKVRYF